MVIIIFSRIHIISFQGIWKNRDDIGSLLKPKTIFKPNNSREQRQKKIDNYERWKRACLHFADFNEK